MQNIIRLVNWIDKFNDRTGKIFSFLVVIMLAVLVYEVVMRYLFTAPTFWGHETSQHVFGAYAVLLGGYALRHKAHVSVDVIYQHWSRRTRAIVNLFSWSLFWFFAILLLVEGFDAAWDSLINLHHTNTPWSPPYYPLKITIPVGAFLVLLQGFAIYIRNLHMAITGRELTPEPEIARGEGE